MPNFNAINLSNPPTTKATVKATKPAVVNQTHVPSIPAASKAHSFSAPQNNYNNNVTNESPRQQQHLPFVASRIDDFINNNSQLQSPHEHKISSSSVEENDDNYEPYTRRDFRIDVKPQPSSDKISNDTSSGYFTSPNENEKSLNTQRDQSVLSPDSSDYEKFNIVKHRDEYSSSPADSQSGRSASSSHYRKSVSFDLDVEEYTPDYTSIDDEPNFTVVQPQQQPKYQDEDVFYEKSRYHHQQLQPEPKRIKGILRSASPNVYYKGNLSNRLPVEQEYIEDDDTEGDEGAVKENPFRKEYLSQERLNEPTNAQGVTSDSDQSDIRYQSVRRSFENLNSSSQSKIPIKKPIFKSTGNLVDRPKIPPPRPPQPNIKVAEMVKNEGLQRMSQHMEEPDFLEFVHNAETNTIEEVKGQELFDPDDPLPPLPKCPPPLLIQYKRGNSFERPKQSPPPPPTPKPSTEEIIEILPAKFDNFPIKQKPHFVNENSQNNILVTEEEHREILLTENEMRNAMLNEYDDKPSQANTEMLIAPFSPTNPFLDETSSFDSFQSTPNVLSPISTLDRSGTNFGQYVPAYQQSVQHVQPINILPPPAQVLPVHYGQLPKPQQTGYYPLMSHQYPLHYNNAPSTGSIPLSQHHHQFQHHPVPQTYIHQQNISEPSSSSYGVEHHHLPPSSLPQQQQQQHHQQQQRAYLVSGDGQNNFYVTHNVNNTATSNNQQQHQTLLMQSAYGPLSQPSPPNQASIQTHMQASQYVASTQANNNQPQFIYEQQHLHQQPFYTQQQTTLRNNNIQFVDNQQHLVSELSPIRINPIPQNFMYPPSSGDGEQKRPSMSSFGKQTEV